jgi:type II restriction enzyme
MVWLMGVNLDKPHLWKQDVAASVDMYNAWFMEFAPQAFRETRVKTTESVEAALAATGNLTDVKPDLLRKNPTILPTLRMSCCPPLAVDRLIGLAGVSDRLVECMEKDACVPKRMPEDVLVGQLQKIGDTIEKMADPDIFVWLQRGDAPSEAEVHRAATIVADRLCLAWANPIIRNAQEARQLASVKAWLEARGYRHVEAGERVKFNEMDPGTFSFRLNVPVTQEGGNKSINIPVDAVIMPLKRPKGQLPVLIEAKSAGDFTNTNKRRKEEATKMQQLRGTYGEDVEFNLFLCGYFDSGYLGYEAAEGIDWVWEHRIDDLKGFGI